MNKSILIKILPFLVVLLLISCNKDNGNNPLNNSERLEQGFNSQYIVVFAESKIAEITGSGGIEAKVKSLLADHQIPTSDLLFVYDAAIHGFAVRVSHDKAIELTKDSRVSYVEPDKEIKLEDPMVTNNEYKNNKIQTQGESWGVDYVRANKKSDCSGSRYNTAWIIDTGIDPGWASSKVPELNIQTSLCRNYTTANKSYWADENGHGTHVAGIIGAKNNNIGVVGVAPGAKLVAVKVLSSNGSGTYSQVIAGVNYVASAAISGDAANMSLGGGASISLDKAVINASTYNNKTITICLAAGNDRASATNYSPARANGRNVNTIAAFNSRGQWASFSNYGQSPVDYAAPGVGILSLVLYKSRTNTDFKSGTSVATPFATGIFVATGSIGTNGTVTRSGTDTYYKVHF